MKKLFTFKNTEIAFSDKGKGRVIVLLHGFLETSAIWTEYQNKLAKQYRVICIDLLGHGDSNCNGYIHTMEQMAEYVKAVLNKLNLRKYIIIGHSMGGYVALAFAEMYPDNVKGLGLFNSTASADSEEKKSERERAIVVVKRNHKKYIKEVIPNLFTKEYVPLLKNEIEDLLEEASSLPKQGIIAGLEGMKIRMDREVIIKFAQYPVLFIAGKKDKTVTFQSLKEQFYLPEKSQVLVLENSGHMSYLEAKQDCLKAIKKFVRSIYKSKVTV